MTTFACLLRRFAKTTNEISSAVFTHWQRPMGNKPKVDNLALNDELCSS